MTKDKDFISLKEAAQISGYAPDYLGQLIREGKLAGKQVYSNVSWVTTEQAVRNYIEQRGKTTPEGGYGAYAMLKERWSDPEKLSLVYTVAIKVAIGIVVLFLLFLSYVLAASIDRKIEQNALQRVEAKNHVGS